MRLATTKKATTMTTISSNTSTKAVTTQMRRRGGGKATEVARRSPVAFVGHVVGRANLLCVCLVVNRRRKENRRAGLRREFCGA